MQKICFLKFGLIRSFIGVGVLALSISMFARPSYGQEYSSISFAELTQIVEASGLSYQITNGMIDITSGPFVGVTGCNSEGRCTDVLITLIIDDIHPTLEKVNQWNQTRKIPEASRNDDGTLLFESYMTAKGITPTAIMDTVDWFWKAISDDKSFWTDTNLTS